MNCPKCGRPLTDAGTHFQGWGGTECLKGEVAKLRDINGKLLAASVAVLGRLQNPMLDTSLFDDVKQQLADAIKETTKP